MPFHQSLGFSPVVSAELGPHSGSAFGRTPDWLFLAQVMLSLGIPSGYAWRS